MLVFFLTETILRLRTTQRKYSSLLSELEKKGLFASSDRPTPALSKGFGGGNNTKKTKAMEENDNKFIANSVKHVIEHLIIKSPPSHREAGLTVVERVACRERYDDKFNGPALNWWKSSFCYGSVSTAGASTFSLEDAMDGCSLSDARPVFGKIDNVLSICPHGLVCCVEGAQWACVEKHLEARSFDRHFATNPRPTNDAEKALAGLLYNINDFEMLDYLGGGAFGKCALARLRSNPAQQCALKLVSVDLVSDHTDLRYLAQEIIHTNKVESVHTAKVLGYFAVPDLALSSDPKYKYTVAIMMEYCGPATLLKHIRSPAIKEMIPPCRAQWACGILEQVLRGVNAIHDKGLSHRDLKPANICVGNDGLVKIIDMGLLRTLPDGNVTNAISSAVGSSPYIPPQGGGATHDEYSVGVILCELICGERPFKHEHEKEFLDAVPVANRLFEAFGFGPYYNAETAANLCNAINSLMTLVMRLLEPSNHMRMKCKEALKEAGNIKGMLGQWE
ncbi:MAG: hypothetical protein SGARI_001530 [Bacillariaceae sp.]